MKRLLYFLMIVVACSSACYAAKGETTREERKLILDGNKLYKEKKYDLAAQKYMQAININPNSAEAQYNLGLTYLQLGAAQNLDEKKREEIMKQGTEAMEHTASLGAKKPLLASRASYNLGNVAFNSQKYPEALECYKQALRLNPNDDDARRNLRITQLKMQNQNQDKNKDQNKDKDKDKDQNKDQNKDKNKDQDKKDQDKKDNQQNQNQDQQQQQQQRMNPETAKQILQAMENKENMTRSRLNKQNSAPQKTVGRKNW